MANLFKVLFVLMCALLIVAVVTTIITTQQAKQIERLGFQEVSDCLASHGIYIVCSGTKTAECEKYRQNKWGGATLPKATESSYIHEQADVAYWFFPPNKKADYKQRPYAVAKAGGCI